jgi:site-specific recombinase XerD
MPAPLADGVSPQAHNLKVRMGAGELEEHLERFSRDYLKGKSKETVGTYRRTLNEFERFHALHKGSFRWSAEGVEQYKKHLMETRGLHQVSVSTYLTAVRRFCQYLTDAGVLAENPARKVKGNRRPATHSRSILTESEIATLLAELSTETVLDARDRAVVFLMLYAGLSEIEIVRADMDDVDHSLMGVLLRVQGKGRQAKDQEVPLDAHVVEALQAYQKLRGPVGKDAPLFASHGRRSEGQRLNTRTVRSRVNGVLKAADLKRKGVKPHSLTHTAALLWLNDGLTLEDVKRRMRHGTLDTTLIYFKKQGLLTRSPEEVARLEAGAK